MLCTSQREGVTNYAGILNLRVCVHVVYCVHNYIVSALWLCIYIVCCIMRSVCTMAGLQVSNVQVGKMDIVWRSRFGERGRIQTGQLKATVIL